jgi:hypothetical protein
LLPVVALLVAAAAPAQEPPNDRVRAPILLAQINNLDDVRLVLIVYNDGEAILARKDADEPDGEICSAVVPPAGLEALRASLHEAGAHHLKDAAPVPNVTRKTISVFIGPEAGGPSRGNTFGYSAAVEEYLIVARALGVVIGENFGDCI